MPQARQYKAFISHHKADAALSARYLKEHLEPMLGGEIFLDSDQLGDLRLLLAAAKDSDVLVLVQTKEVLLRPYCLAEIYTAIIHKVPIVCVALRRGGYVHERKLQFTEALSFLCRP